jgi:hypothetical protein
VIHFIFGWFSAVGEKDISTVYANFIADSREQRQASSTVRLPIHFELLYPKIKACILLAELAPPAPDLQPFRFWAYEGSIKQVDRRSKICRLI